MANRGGQNLLVLAAFLIVFIAFVAVFASSAIGIGFAGPGIAFSFFFFIIIVVIIIGIAARSRPRIQRPYTDQTAFPPPPPPDTVLVRCPYCGTSQTFKETCESCGAPLPRPQFN